MLLKEVKLNTWYRKVYNIIIHIIANNDLPLNTCHKLDKMLKAIENGEMTSTDVKVNFDPLCKRILIADELIEWNQYRGWTVTEHQAKFNGYTAAFERRFYGNFLRGLWNLLISIIIPLLVAYWTIKLTLPTTQPVKPNQAVESLDL